MPGRHTCGGMRNRPIRNRTPIAKIFTPMAFTVALKPGRLGAGSARKVRGGKSATARARYRSLGKAPDATEALCSVRFRGTSPIFPAISWSVPGFPIVKHGLRVRRSFLWYRLCHDTSHKHEQPSIILAAMLIKHAKNRCPQEIPCWKPDAGHIV